jgi:hypothetical protein
MKEPDMLWDSGIQAVVNGEIDEECLPLESKPMCDVVPESLNTRVVDAPAMKLTLVSEKRWHATHRPQM